MLALLFRISRRDASSARDVAAAAAAGAEAEADATAPSTLATSTPAASAPGAPAAVAEVEVGPAVLEAGGTVRAVAGWASMSATDREWTRRQADHAAHIAHHMLMHMHMHMHMYMCMCMSYMHMHVHVMCMHMSRPGRC